MQVGDIPNNEEALINSVLNDGEARFNSADLNVAYKMTVDEYYKKCDYARELEENWGPAPGQLNTNGQELLVFGKQFGNVFIGVQPTFGYEGDPMRLLFSKSASPHHGFAAYYTYLEKVFEADAVLHFGTHGSLEFMPGKQARTSSVHVVSLPLPAPKRPSGANQFVCCFGHATTLHRGTGCKCDVHLSETL